MFELLIKGGWVMLPLAICSIVAVTIVVERLRFFKRTGAAETAEHIISLVAQGQVNEALVQAKTVPVPLTNVLLSGINNRLKPAKAMEAAGIAEISVLKRGLSVLDTIITLSPLLGLLGTIIGMINSFQVMAVAGMGQPHAVTGGVAEALIATATGITVAVITLIPYNYFLTRVEKETEVIEHYATKLEIALETLHHRSDKYEDTKKYA